MTDLSPISPDHQHLDVGRDTFALSANGVPLRFSPQEKKFLIALDETHSLDKACERVGKPVEWAKTFFKRPKIYEWMTKIAAEESAKSGMTIRWIRSQMMAVYLGKETWWEGECATCHVKQKSWIEPEDDKGVLSAPCLACQSPVLMNQVDNPIRKDRQQMVALQELASRVDPKIERISHEFTGEEFIFSAKESD